MFLPPLRYVSSLNDDRPWESYENSDPDAWKKDKIRWKELISAELTGSRDLWVAVIELDEGEEHLQHCHPSVSQFYFIIAGEGLFTVGGRELKGVAGTSIYIPAGTWHGFKNTATQTLIILEGFNDLTKVSKLLHD